MAVSADLDMRVLPLSEAEAQEHIAVACFRTGPVGAVGLELERTVHDVADPARPVPVAEARAAGLSAAPVMHLDAPGWDRDALVGLLAIWAAEGTAVLSDHPRDEALQRDLAAERVGLTWS